nr:hypothetical protein [Tanacetum cinerariifolium]
MSFSVPSSTLQRDSEILKKFILFLPDFRVIVPLSNLISALAVVKNGVPKIKGYFLSSLTSKIMKNANPPPTNNLHVLAATLCARAVQEPHELQVILASVNSRLKSIGQFLNNLANQPNETNMNDLESDDEVMDTPLVSLFPHSDNHSDDGEVLNELSEYENVEALGRERIINGFDRVDPAFQCMIGFRKFTAYLDPFLPINIILRKAYNTIMVEGL